MTWKPGKKDIWLELGRNRDVRVKLLAQTRSSHLTHAGADTCRHLHAQTRAFVPSLLPGPQVCLGGGLIPSSYYQTSYCHNTLSPPVTLYLLLSLGICLFLCPSGKLGWLHSHAIKCSHAVQTSVSVCVCVCACELAKTLGVRMGAEEWEKVTTSNLPLSLHRLEEPWTPAIAPAN